MLLVIGIGASDLVCIDINAINEFLYEVRGGKRYLWFAGQFYWGGIQFFQFFYDFVEIIKFWGEGGGEVFVEFGRGEKSELVVGWVFGMFEGAALELANTLA